MGGKYPKVRYAWREEEEEERRRGQEGADGEDVLDGRALVDLATRKLLCRESERALWRESERAREREAVDVEVDPQLEPCVSLFHVDDKKSSPGSRGRTWGVPV